jgi:hypothetical protein
MTLYGTVLFVHSLLRWVILPAGLAVCVRSWLASRSGRPWERGDEKLQVLLASVLDLQFLLGISLYALLSPFSRAFFDDFRMGMEDPVVRFFGLEHVAAMVVAIAVVHIGRARSKKAEGARRHRVVWISTLIALLLILLSIPWPGFPYARPLLRGLGLRAESRSVAGHEVQARTCRPRTSSLLDPGAA